MPRIWQRRSMHCITPAKKRGSPTCPSTRFCFFIFCPPESDDSSDVSDMASACERFHASQYSNSSASTFASSMALRWSRAWAASLTQSSWMAFRSRETVAWDRSSSLAISCWTLPRRYKSAIFRRSRATWDGFRSFAIIPLDYSYGDNLSIRTIGYIRIIQ